jgi:hypothetical protein
MGNFGTNRPDFRFNKPLPEGKMRRYVHKPFTLEDGNTKISCSENGKVTFKREEEVEGEIEEHEITVSASTIFSLADMLNTTKSTKIVDKEPK